jgi:enoyl-CoA hydratase/carnithine racemase
VIEVVSRGQVVELWLSREAKRNAVDAEMRAKIVDALNSVDTDAVRVVLLRARGTVFCAGLDLKERAETLGSGGVSPIEPVLEAVRGCPVPVVAVMQGDALAGGCELVLACDLVLATPDAALGMPLVRLGMMPNPRLIGNLIDALGQNTARAMLMLGERIPAAELVKTRSVWKVVPPDQLDAAANALADRLADMPQLAMRTVKATINRLSDRSNMPGMADIEAMVLEVQRSADAQEGIRAHLSRRPPVFRGE